MRTERLTLRELCEPPEGLTLDFSEANRARKERANAFLQGVGAPHELLKEIGCEFSKRLQEIMHVPTTTYSSGLTVTRLPDELRVNKKELLPPPPPPPPPPDPHRFFVFRPPYDGWQTGWNPALETGAFRVAHEVFLKEWIGWVGHHVTLDIDSASDIDMACAVADTQVSFWFESPIPGHVEVRSMPGAT